MLYSPKQKISYAKRFCSAYKLQFQFKKRKNSPSFEFEIWPCVITTLAHACRKSVAHGSILRAYNEISVYATNETIDYLRHLCVKKGLGSQEAGETFSSLPQLRTDLHYLNKARVSVARSTPCNQDSFYTIHLN